MDKIRKTFTDQLSGRGIEIGALHRPMVKHDGMDMTYVDMHPAEKLKEMYPELGDVEFKQADIIDEAETLEKIPSDEYDFLITAHLIEHTRNPIKALQTWFRVLKPGGLMYLVTPHYRKIFDKDRQLTPTSHIIADYLNERSPEKHAEMDFLHYLDYAKKVDKKRGDELQAYAKGLQAIDARIHFHTFTPQSMERLLNWFNSAVLSIRILQGPRFEPWDVEFHFLLQKPGLLSET